MMSPHRSLQRRTSNRTTHPMALRALPRPSPLSLLVSVLFLPLPVLGPFEACAQVIADPTAGPHERPVIHSTANGLPQVDITAPTAGGVSVNRFTQFDIDAAGVIVNNGRTASQTALAGWVAANPALLSSPARVIVGEVRGPLPSQLNGLLEIAGAKADFILANPSGITCNGCGFLNAQRVELATGTPHWPAGALTSPSAGRVPSQLPGVPLHYVMGPASFTLGGAGLDARGNHAVSILTRAAQINAGLWAQHLQLTLAGPAAATAGAASPAPPPPASFALDVAALGGVAARSIYLVGTADGLGARNLGTLAADDRLVVTLDGKLVNAGTLDARHLHVAATDLDNLAHGRLLGEQVALSTGRLANAGHPDAAPVIAATDRLDIGARVLENTDGALLFSGGDMAIGGALDAAGHATAQAETVLNRAATIEALGKLQIATRQLANLNGGVVIDEEPLGPPTQHALLQPTGSAERHDLNRFRFEGWSRAGQYRWITDATQIDDGVLGSTPIEPVPDETCVGEGEAEVCTPVRGTSYPADDPVWAYFGLTPPEAAPPPPGPTPTPPTLTRPAPLPEGLAADDPAHVTSAQQQAAYDRAWADYHQQRAEHERATATWTAWEAATDTRRAALEQAIDRYNAGFDQQLIRSWTQYHLTRSAFQSVVTASSPAGIIAGGDLTLVGDDLVNDRSRILAGGKLLGTLANLTQIEALGTHRVSETGTSQFTKSRWRGGVKRYHQRDWGPVLPYAPADQITTIVLPVTVTRENADPAAPALDIAAQRLTRKGNALWQVNPAPGSGPVFVTDPRLTRYRDWISSDVMLERLQLDPAAVMLRLGDGFIEQRLVREQIAQLTGRRWLPGHGDDDAQYAALLASGVHHAQALPLRPGIALSAEQVAQLTSDLVWLVERDVTLPDGRTQRVLVPQVYLRPREGDLAGDGTLIAGDTVELLVRDTLRNAGTIAAQQALNIDAGRFEHSGTLAADAILASAATDLQVRGGSVVARDSATLVAGRDLVLESTTTHTERTRQIRSGSSQAQRTQLDRVASLQVGGTGPGGGALVVAAGRDVVLQAAAVSHTGTGPTHLSAGRDLHLATITTDARLAAQGRDARNFLRERDSTEVGTRIDVQGDIVLAAGQDATLQAATVRSESGGLALEAGRDVSITAGAQTREQAQGTYFKHRSAVGSTRSTTRTEAARTDVVGSELGAATVTIDAGRDARVTGSTVVADGKLHLAAGGELTLDTATATTHQSAFRQTTRSGLMGSGGIGVTLGRQRITGESVTTTTTDVGATVGSLTGDVTLMAGSKLTQTASTVLAPAGDIVMTAPTVTIDAGTHHETTTQRSEVKQSGVTIALSNPVITAVQTAQQMSEAASNTKDGRMKALAAANTAMAAANAYDAVKAGQGTTIDGKANQIKVTGADGKDTSRDATAADKVGGIQLSISVGSARSNSQTVVKKEEALGSTVAAGGNVTIAATGGLQHSDVTVQGSQIAAGQQVTLMADHALNLQAAANIGSQQSQNSNASASVGVTLAVGPNTGVGVNVSASGGKGKADGDDLRWTNTQLAGGEQVRLQSGGDTRIRGAVVAAPKVTVASGGQLTIDSLQDRSTYQSRQQHIGGSVTAGIGTASGANLNAAQGSIDSEYLSVTEQSGIRAGDGGFEVQVAGDTHLKGGAITSTQAAIDAQRNQFATGGTLTATDLENRASYQAESVSVNVGTGFSAAGALTPAGTGVGLGNDSGQAASTTRSGISGIAGDQALRTGDKETGIAPIFDADRVQREVSAQTQITQTFSTLAPRAVASYADGQIKAINEQLQQEGDAARRTELLAEKQRWGDGGAYRVALHAAVGGLAGGAQGAAGAGTSAVLVPQLAQALDQTDLPASVKSAVVASAGSLLGAAVGGNAGAAAALGETANNFLSHSEARQREAAQQQLFQCQDDSCRQQARQAIARLDALDQWRDQQVADACLTPSSALCQGWHAALADAKLSYEDYTARGDLTQSVAAERRQVNEQEFLYRRRIADPFAYGVAKGLMKLTPPALLLGVGLSTYQVTSAVIEVGAVEAAIAIASGLKELPAELQSRLNSDDPTVRGEALVDTLAITSASTVIVGRLQQTGNQAVTRALEKQAALQAEARAVTKTKAENNVYRDSSLADPGKPVMSATGPWIPAAQLSPGQADALVEKSLPQGVQRLGSESADGLNRNVLRDNPAYSPPYVPGTQAVLVATTSETQFVRVYSPAQGSNSVGDWFMPTSEIQALTAEQIASKYALPQVPTHVVDVRVPPGHRLRVTVANDINIFPDRSLGGNGGGGGVQYELLDKLQLHPSWFSNERRLK